MKIAVHLFLMVFLRVTLLDASPAFAVSLERSEAKLDGELYLYEKKTLVRDPCPRGGLGKNELRPGRICVWIRFQRIPPDPGRKLHADLFPRSLARQKA